MELRCATCGIKACSLEPGSKDPPLFCPSERETEILDSVRDTYAQDEETRRLAIASARVEAEGYQKWPRVQEVMAFARQLGVDKLGIATCIGLIREAEMLQEILEINGFSVFSVCCKVGSIPKEDIGLADSEKVRPGRFEALCNPVAQARLLNVAGTGLNIVVGLCVGHDSLFFRNSRAPVTVLVAKDRVLGHNPVAALYASHSYWRKLRGE